MRPANTYRGARKRAAKEDKKVWRHLLFERKRVGKRGSMILKNCP